MRKCRNRKHTSEQRVSFTANPRTYGRKDKRCDIPQTVGQERYFTAAQNVIVFIGDGMGISTVTAARILKGQLAGQPGEETVLNFEKFPYTGLIKTYSEDKQVTDSAASATAIYTGVKTKSRMLRVDDSHKVGTCVKPSEGIPGIMQWTQEKGKSTGFVTTSRVTHATPAGLYAVTTNRDWESPRDAPTGCMDIATQLVRLNPDIKVIMGGGVSNFLKTGFIGASNASQTLIQAWEEDKINRSKSYGVAYDRAQLEAMNMDKTDYVLGKLQDLGIRSLGIHSVGKRSLGKRSLGIRKCISSLGKRSLCIRSLGIRILGIRSLGIRSLGIRSLGIRSLGIRSLCIRSLGKRSLGIHSLGKRSLSIRSLGKRSLGIRSLGIRSLGIRSLGIRSLSIRSLGIRSLGIRSLGIRSLGIRSLSIHRVGKRSLGKRSLGIRKCISSLGLFSSGHMDYEIDRNTNPSGARIDHAHHETKAKKALYDTLAFEEAVQVALNLTNPEETLTIVTADHSHVFTINGYPDRGNGILDLARPIVDNMALDNQPYTTLMYTNGPNAQSVRANLTFRNTQYKEFQQQSTVPLSSETHGGEDVAIYAQGPMAHLVTGVKEQNVIAYVMAHAACVGDTGIPCENGREQVMNGQNNVRNSGTALNIGDIVVVTYIIRQPCWVTMVLVKHP
ncbi:PPBT-like protein [Mya arenaria]|uniref:Alkaline phosphatase n=1 Tax=Mya arenaria TaxID=6604 RepID=A0ABY7EXV9_MYAAR|nr:PPBT-like protein [Mya arenaria]